MKTWLLDNMLVLVSLLKTQYAFSIEAEKQGSS